MRIAKFSRIGAGAALIALLFPVMAAGLAVETRDGMALVPGGAFRMGFETDNDLEWGDADEEPVHAVILDPYWIDLHETAASDFSAFLNAHPQDAGRYLEPGPAVTIEKTPNGHAPKPGLERFPANRVSWYGADAYCKWKGKRLPTEAEWEKAARGTDERIFPWGNTHPTDEVATYRRHFDKLGFKSLSPVDQMEKGRSPYGLYHMAGNVWEWVADWFDPDYYKRSPKKNPQGPVNGTSKVLRGGNWYYKAYYMRATYRFNEKPEAFKVWQGFRCAGNAG
jgi:formylglycine-generating enzyme required for sulfatase activity